MKTEEFIKLVNKNALLNIEEALKSSFDDKTKIDLIGTYVNASKRNYKSRLASTVLVPLYDGVSAEMLTALNSTSS